MPTAFISPVFHAQVERLSLVATSAAAAATQDEQRRWHVADLQGWDGDVYNLGRTGTGMGAAFNRDDLNQAYAQAIATSGQEGGGLAVDRRVAKTQVDYLACLERAYRARHASSVRCRLQAAARRQGQGQAAGCFRNVREFLASDLALHYAV